MLSLKLIAAALEKYHKAPPSRQAQLVLVVAVVSFISTALILSKTTMLTALVGTLTSGASAPIWFLLIATSFLAIAHAAASILETQWATLFYPKLMPTPPINVLFIAAFYGAVICFLASLSGMLQFYLPLYLIFCVVDILGMGMLSEQVKHRLESVEKREIKPDQSLLNEIRLFYVDRPWKKLGAFRLILVAIALLLLSQDSLHSYAYFIMVFALGINEVVVWWWRIRLYRRHKFFFV